MKDIKQAVQVGDWVCFKQFGTPVYGLVLYVQEDKYSTLGSRIITTSGEYREPDTLEIRRVQP